MQLDECSECTCDKTREKEKKENRWVLICWYELPPCQKYWFLCLCVCKGNEHMWVRDNWEKWLIYEYTLKKKCWKLSTEYWFCIYPRKIHLFNYELVCMCALQTDRGIYCVCIKCVCVNDISSLVGPVLPIWRLSEFRVMECQSWKLDACGKGRFYRGPAVPLSSDTHTNTHAAKCHAQICTQPHTLSGHSACTWRGPHAHDPLPPFHIFHVSEARKRQKWLGIIIRQTFHEIE